MKKVIKKERIEFSRRRRKQDAKTRRKISLGLDKFWDKEGRQSEKEKAKTRRNVKLGLATLGIAGAVGGGALYLNKRGKKGPSLKKVPKPVSKITLDDGQVVNAPKAPAEQIGRPGVERPYTPARGEGGKPIYRADLDDNIGLAAQEESKRRAANAARENEKRVVDPSALGDAGAKGSPKKAKSKKGKNRKNTNKKPINNRDMTVAPERGEPVQRKEEFSPERKERFKKARNANRRSILQSESVRDARRALRRGQKGNVSPEEIEKLQGRVDAQKRLRKKRYERAKNDGAWFKKAHIESVIEFSRKRKQDAKTRQRISRSLENFWNKKGKKSDKRILNKTAKIALAGAGIVGTGVAAHQLNKKGLIHIPGIKKQPTSSTPTPIATVGTKEQEKVVAEAQKQVSKTVNPAPKQRKKSPGKQLSLFDTKPYKTKKGKRGPKSGNIVDYPPKQITPYAPKPSSDGGRQLTLKLG